MLQCYRRLKCFKCPTHRIDDDVFGNFICTRFYHSDTRLDTSDYQIKVARRTLLGSEKRLKLTSHTTNAQTSHGTVKWCTGQHQRSTRRDHCYHVGTEIRVHAEHTADHLDFLAIALWKEWSDRTINESTDQDRFIARTAFALDETATANFAGCIHFFFVVDAQGEIVEHNRLSTHHRRTEHHSVTVGNEHTGGGAKADAVDFERQFLAAKIGRNGNNILAIRVDNTHRSEPPFIRSLTFVLWGK